MPEQPDVDTLSLNDIEGDVRSGASTVDAPSDAESVDTLRRRPIGLLGAEDLRRLIDQGQGVETLVPPALSRLEEDPSAAGGSRDGALLEAVLHAPRAYWSAHPEQRARLEPVIVTVTESFSDSTHDAWEAAGALIVELRAAEAAPDDFGPGTPSLEQVENDYWGAAPPEATDLVEDVHALRQKPVGVLGVEGVRQLLEQHEGVPVLVPRALTYLEVHPLVAGDYYPGDLLAMVLHAPSMYWAEHPAERARLDAVIHHVWSMGDDVVSGLVPRLRERMDAFSAREW
jgi:hypothetical protein